MCWNIDGRFLPLVFLFLLFLIHTYIHNLQPLLVSFSKLSSCSSPLECPVPSIPQSFSLTLAQRCSMACAVTRTRPLISIPKQHLTLGLCRDALKPYLCITHEQQFIYSHLVAWVTFLKSFSRRNYTISFAFIFDFAQAALNQQWPKGFRQSSRENCPRPERCMYGLFIAGCIYSRCTMTCF